MTDIKYWDWAREASRTSAACREFNRRGLFEWLCGMGPPMRFVLVPPVVITNEELDRVPQEENMNTEPGEAQ